MLKLPVYIQEAPEQDGTYSIHDNDGALVADLMTRDTAQTLARRLNDASIIRVFMEGGVIQGVADIPPGVVVEVVDFDEEGEHFDKKPCSVARYGADVSLMELDARGSMRTRAQIEKLDNGPG